MFSSLNLFQTLRCPEVGHCIRPQCVFSHRQDLPPPATLSIPVHDPKVASTSTLPRTGPSQTSTVPTKRAVPSSPVRPGALVQTPSGEPPRKLQKVGIPQRPLAVSTSSHTNVQPSRTCLCNIRLSLRVYRMACPSSEPMLRYLRLPFLSDRCVQPYRLQGMLVDKYPDNAQDAVRPLRGSLPLYTAQEPDHSVGTCTKARRGNLQEVKQTDIPQRKFISCTHLLTLYSSGFPGSYPMRWCLEAPSIARFSVPPLRRDRGRTCSSC